MVGAVTYARIVAPLGPITAQKIAMALVATEMMRLLNAHVMRRKM